MYVSFLATFHLTDFRENENNMIWSTYLNQQAPRVSVFRIYAPINVKPLGGGEAGHRRGI